MRPLETQYAPERLADAGRTANQAVVATHTIESLAGSIASNLSQAESISFQIRARLFGSAPAQPTGICGKDVSEPTLEQRMHDFAERTFALHQELGFMLSRISG